MNRLSILVLIAAALGYPVFYRDYWLYVAIILYNLGMRITCTSCTVTCAEELPNEERATGRGFCQALASPVAIVTPLLAAWLISRFGGLCVEGIRPLYVIQTLIFVGIFVLLLTQLSSAHGHSGPDDGHLFFRSFVQVFAQGSDVKRMMLVMGLMELPWTMARPFMPV